MRLCTLSLHVNTGLFAVSPPSRRPNSFDDTFKLFVGLYLIGEVTGFPFVVGLGFYGSRSFVVLAHYQNIWDCDLVLVFKGFFKCGF